MKTINTNHSIHRNSYLEYCFIIADNITTVSSYKICGTAYEYVCYLFNN